jgi:hypothetical protein
LQDGVNQYVWIYFVVLIIFGAFFAVNLALAVLYLHFTQAQAEVEIAREEEARKRKMTSKMSSSKAAADDREPSLITGQWNGVRNVCHQIQASPYFEGLTMMLIVLNTIVMASSYDSMSAPHVKVRISRFRCCWL